jgi:hypothetical protein
MMNNNTINKWEILLATLTVAKKSGLICSEAEIDEVEKEPGFKFPAGYWRASDQVFIRRIEKRL